MFCSKCGKENLQNAKFCGFCGVKIISSKSVANNIVLEGERKDKLQKLYEKTATYSIGLSFFGFIISALVILNEYTFMESLFGLLIFALFLVPFLYFGQKIEKEGIECIEYALKVSRGMFIYTAIFVVVNILCGGLGFLWLFLLYYYFKSYRETKKLLYKNKKIKNI